MVLYLISLIFHFEKQRRYNSCSFWGSPDPGPACCAALAPRGVHGRGLQAQPRPLRKVAVTCCGSKQGRTASAPEPPGPRNCCSLQRPGAGRGREERTGRKHSLAHTYSDRKPGESGIRSGRIELRSASICSPPPERALRAREQEVWPLTFGQAHARRWSWQTLVRQVQAAGRA